MDKKLIKPMKRYPNLKELVNSAAENYGTMDAYKFKRNKEIVSKSFVDLKADSQAFSNFLKAKDLLGKHVAVIGMSSYEWVVTYFGTVNSNSVIVPIDKELPAGEISELLNRADVETLVFDDVLSDRIDAIINSCPDIKYFIGMNKETDEGNILSFQKIIDENQGAFDVEIDNDKMCTILFTSGTTGKSKGVMLSHTSLIDNTTCVEMGEQQNSTVLSVLPIHHVYCFTCDILVGLYLGSVVCFNDSIMRLAKNIAVFKPHIILLVPMIIETLLFKLNEASKANPNVPKNIIGQSVFGENLRRIYSGGAYLNPKLTDGMAEFGIEVLQGYGMSEFSPRISVNIHGCSKRGSVGFVVPGAEAKIEDGEILVRGKSMMLGYYKDEKNTAETIVDGWLRTGDLGYIDEDGFIFITGRKKNLIILANGENVSPEELENKFNGWYVAKELMVYSENNQITCEIYPNSEFIAKANIADVNAAVNAKVDEVNRELPLYKRIAVVKIRENEFEKTASGKIKRK
ncbi:MAG: AMP-binding protein [Acutalibacteraceae bacterium]